jgi:hypothetical protein
MGLPASDRFKDENDRIANNQHAPDESGGVLNSQVEPQPGRYRGGIAHCQLQPVGGQHQPKYHNQQGNGRLQDPALTVSKFV